MAGIEHMGAGFAAKWLERKVPLAVLLIACEVLDILWIIFTLMGLESMEHAYWSHSLLMAAVWSVAGGIIAAIVFKGPRAGVVVGGLIFSHWILDFISHPMTFQAAVAKGLPLYFSDTPLVGLGLYSTLWGLIIGMVLFAGPGIVLYVLHRIRLKKERQTPEPGTQS
jgi:hypothetical protein